MQRRTMLKAKDACCHAFQSAVEWPEGTRLSPKPGLVHAESIYSGLHFLCGLCRPRLTEGFVRHLGDDYSASSANLVICHNLDER